MSKVLTFDQSLLGGCTERLLPLVREEKFAIDARLHELQMDHGGTPEERQAISDALAGLNVLRREIEARSQQGLEQGDDAHPMKEDVKKKFLSLPSRDTQALWLASSPVSLLRGFLVLPLWITACFSGDANPSCWFPGNGFISPWALDADPSRSYASLWVGFQCQPSSYVKLEADGFFGWCEGE